MSPQSRSPQRVRVFSVVVFSVVLVLLCVLVSISSALPPVVSANDPLTDDLPIYRLVQTLGINKYFFSPHGVAVANDGTVVVSATSDHCMYAFDRDGSLLTAWGSTGSENAQFSSPAGVAFADDGTLFVVDRGNNRIQVFARQQNGTYRYYTKWGRAGSQNGQFNAPSGIAVVGTATVFVADTGNHRIQVFAKQQDGTYRYQTQWSRTSDPYEPEFSPNGVAATDDGTVFVTDGPNNRVEVFAKQHDGTYAYQTQWGSKGSGDGQFMSPYGIAVADDGRVFVADRGNYRIQVFAPQADGTYVYQTQWKSYYATYVAVADDGTVFVTGNGIQVFTQQDDGTYVYQIQWSSFGSGDGQFDSPFGVAVARDGTAFVADVYNNRIQVFARQGDGSYVYQTQWGSQGRGDGQFNTPYDVAVARDGTVFVVDGSNSRIQVFARQSDGTYAYQTQWGNMGRDDGQFTYSYGIAVADDGRVFVADTGNNRIQVFAKRTDGTYAFESSWGYEGKRDGLLRSPSGVAVARDGRVFVADMGNHCIKVFARQSDGTYVYQTQWGSKGKDNGQFMSPYGIAVADDGWVFVADTGNYRIQVFAPQADGTYVYQTQWGSKGRDDGQFNGLFGDRYGEDAVLNNIGNIYLSQERYAEALDYYQQSLAIDRELGERAGPGITLGNIGNVYDEQDQYTEALDYYQQALAIHREVGNRGGEGGTLNNIGEVYEAQGMYTEALNYSQQALTIAREVGDRTGESNALNNIGKVYEAQGKYTEALDLYQQAIAIVEDIRRIAGSDQARTRFIGQYVDLYDRAIVLYHKQGQNDQAFVLSEQGRARSFLDSLATGDVQLTDNDAQALFDQERAAYATRQSARDALAKAQMAISPDPALIAELESQLAAAEQAYDAVQASIIARGDQLQDLIPGHSQTVMRIADVQALLDDQTTLVSYHIGEDTSLAFILTRTSVQVIDLSIGAESIEDDVRSIIGAIHLSAPLDSPVHLYNALIVPLKPYLTTTHLAIVPHRSLHYLPFAALTPDHQHYVLDDYVISVLPSASSLRYIRENMQTTTNNALVLGNPDGSLSFAEQAVQHIGAMYGTSPLLGTSATESAVRAQAGNIGILHISAHASFNVYAPLFSTIFLSPDGQHDGKLTVQDVYELDLHQSNLVTLSACETQQGSLSTGDDLVGLTRAFVFAGAPSVLATLWRVEDVATASLIERFYRHMQAGLGKAEALRQAQLEVREEFPHHRYWAAFVLSGDAGAITSAAPAAGPAVTQPAAAPAASDTPSTAVPAGDAQCFDETGFCISGAVRAYWEDNGGLAVFGYPIAAQRDEEIEDTMWPVQWFERDRLEDHGAEGIMAGRLGADVLMQRGTPWESYPRVDGAAAGCVFFAETGHSVCEPFLSVWQQQGGLARFGYPLTEVMEETIGDWTGPVQYFERRRMEHHTENEPPFHVLLGLLGREISEANRTNN